VPLVIERSYPWVGGAVVAAVYLIWFRDHAVPEHISDLFSAVTTIAAISVGLFATAKAMVIQMEDERPIIKKLKDAQHYDLFLRYITLAINTSFAAAVLSAAYLLIDFAERDRWHYVALACWLGTVTLAGLTYFRVVRVLSVVLDRP
jgi:hypothetical protein